MKTASLWRPAGWAALAIVLMALPFIGLGDSALFFLTYILIWSIFALSFDLAFGMAGLLSIGHAVFLGVGGYFTGWLTLKAGVPFVPAWIAGAVGSAVLAVLFGMFALRLSGIFFALTTLALGQLAMIASDTVLAGVTGGQDGMAGVPRPELFGVDFYNADAYLAFTTATFIVVFALVALLRASPFGQVLIAVRTNEVRASQLGFNIKYFKIGVLMFSGFLAGLAGGLLASLIFFINSSILHWSVSGDVVIMALLGGSGSLVGPVLGAIAFETLKEMLSQVTTHWHGLLGLIFMLFVIVIPDGLVGLARRAWLRARRRP